MTKGTREEPQVLSVLDLSGRFDWGLTKSSQATFTGRQDFVCHAWGSVSSAGMHVKFSRALVSDVRSDFKPVTLWLRAAVHVRLDGLGLRPVSEGRAKQNISTFRSTDVPVSEGDHERTSMCASSSRMIRGQPEGRYCAAPSVSYPLCRTSVPYLYAVPCVSYLYAVPCVVFFVPYLYAVPSIPYLLCITNGRGQAMQTFQTKKR